ncbi:copper chaperone PCu(A)C [Lichenihabitans sp. Uapishka_5]|uniref:copper chaperone PCu(A)C n=1 Tax=Lichenihabitans sp. Uapishka_5 TaxID=3037302 RepID=UPI0029E80090|nr:copper chaperone PCu(A)C [Lichenihabitans sp. Uapishka_5]MDX7951551.1 copper chaperone PCu(A)C [Lichenihabitans sp. Uapishka_5]
MSNPFRAGQLAALVCLSLAPSVALAQTVAAGDLVIQRPWARATPNGAPVAGGYLTITNHGTEADTLTGGSLTAAGGFEVHSMSTEGGIMRMRPAGPLTIPPGGSVTLSPSGTHIMFTDLKHGLKQGETVDGTLSFTQAGTVPVRFVVEGIGAKAPGGSAQPAMPGMHMD